MLIHRRGNRAGNAYASSSHGGSGSRVGGVIAYIYLNISLRSTHSGTITAKA